MSLIKEVVPQDHYCLYILMENGSSVTLNFESRLQTIRFGVLSDENVFRSVETNGTFIRWGKKVEISVDEVFQLAQK